MSTNDSPHFDTSVLRECAERGISLQMLQAGYKEICRLGPDGPQYEEVVLAIYMAMTSLLPVEDQLLPR